MQKIAEFKTVNIVSNGYKFYVQYKDNGKLYGGWTAKHMAEFYARMCDNNKVSNYK